MNNFNKFCPNKLPMNYNNGYNFNKSFMPQQPILNRPDYTNENHALHNNIKTNILDEHIVEYKVHIDSADRDTAHYKDPFKYTVTFNAASSEIYKEYKKDGTITEHLIKGTPKPHILKEFKNVKYVKIHSIVMPRHTIMYDDNGTYKLDTDENSDSNVYDDRFVMLNIKELDNTYTYGTNVNTSNSFGLIFPDKLVSKNYYLGIPFFTSDYYKKSKLGTINRLTIEFQDSFGQTLKYRESDGINGNILNSDPLISPNTDGTYSVSQTDVRHPLNKQTQNHISMVIGVVENQIDTDISFEV